MTCYPVGAETALKLMVGDICGLRGSRDIGKILAPFAGWLREGKIVFLVGAGISRDPPALLPVASELQGEVLARIYQYSRILRQVSFDRRARNDKERFLRVLSSDSRRALRVESLLQINLR